MGIEGKQPIIKSYKDVFPATKEEYDRAVRSLLIARFAQKNNLQLSEVSERDADLFAYRINKEFGEGTATFEKIHEGDLHYRVIVPELDYDLHKMILHPDTNEIIPFISDSREVAA